MPNLEDFANIARAMTGSTISTEELFNNVNKIDKRKQKEIYHETDEMVMQNNNPFDKAYGPSKQGFNELARKFDIDAAVLFQIYIQNKK